MEYLSDFNFQIQYTTGKSNQKADILSRREQDVTLHETIKIDSRARTLLSPARLHPRINTELAQAYIQQEIPISIKVLEEPINFNLDSQLIERLKKDNRNSFMDIRQKEPLLVGYSIDNELLLY